MASKFNPVTGDWESDQIGRSRLFADTLRKGALDWSPGQMVSGHYVPNQPWVNALEGLAGGFMGARADAAEGVLGQRREGEVQDWLRRRPSDQAEQSIPAITRPAGNNPDEEGVTVMSPAETKMLPKSSQQLRRDYADWVTSAPKHSPLAQSMQAAQMGSMLAYPDKVEAREDTQAAAVDMAKQKQLDRLAQITAAQAGKPVKRETREMSLANDKVQDQELINGEWKDIGQPRSRFAKQIAGAGAGSSSNLGKLQGKGVSETNLPVSYSPVTGKFYTPNKETGELEIYTGKVTPMAQVGGSAAEKKDVKATDDLYDKIKLAEQGLPYSSGIGTMVPQAVSQFYTSPETKAANASIAAVSAEKAHELYGAAFTAAERARAKQFLPDVGDTVESQRTKIAVIKALLEKKIARREGKPDPHPDLYAKLGVSPILEGEAGSQASTGQIAAPKGGALPQATAAAAPPAATGETKTYKGVTYRLKPGMPRNQQSSWEPVQ